MKIFNSLTRKKEEFVPLEEGKVGIYACGPTVYNYFHIGNARPFIVFDTLRRYLEYRGYQVTFVQNFTDIDDKMIKAANEQGITVKELGEKFIAAYYEDAKGLNIRPASAHPKATEHIGEILSMITTLIEKGHAYLSPNGDVYYDTASFEGYGRLSGQDPEDLDAGARIEINEEKKNPMDFVLWKAKKEGEPFWPSPFGDGRPGWHIECSAMSRKYLGDSFDIHGGGQDLKFPHHDNEIAQSEGCTGKKFARYWMHNGYLNIDNKKMSKSLGNFFTVRDISKEFDLLAVRLFMLSAQYRNPINFSAELISQAETALKRIETCLENLRYISRQGGSGGNPPPFDTETLKARFIEAMEDDLNTADAIGVLFDYVKEANIFFEEYPDAREAARVLSEMTELLGILGLIRAEKEEEIPEEVLRLLEKRAEARKNKNWTLADELREEIKKLGYVVKDGAEGAKIEKA